MNYFIFLICVPLVHSEIHMLTTTYSNEQTISGTLKMSLNTTLGKQKIDYYDSVKKKLIPIQDWMKEFASTKKWKKYTELREQVQQTRELNIPDLMQRFNQTHGVHMYQRVYGCWWNDETGNSSGFEYSYDGKHVKLNEDREQPTILKKYYDSECVYWLKELLHFSKASFEKTGKVPESTEQSLTEPTQNTVNDKKSDGSDSYIIPIVVGVGVIIILVILGLAIYCRWDQIKQCCDKRYYKDVQSDEQSSISEPSVPLQRKDLHSPSQ